MNSQEAMNLLRQVLTLSGGILTGMGVIDHEQANTIINDVAILVPASISLGSVVWSVYVHWNMKKVPENARVS